MAIADFRERRNWAMYLSIAALIVSLAAFSRSNSPNPSAQNNDDDWKAIRQYPPLVFNSTAWLDCSISSTENGKQVMTTLSGQGFSFDAIMLPIKSSKLQLTGQNGMMYKFDSFPSAAVKARFSGLGEGLITEMKSEVEVSVSTFKQPSGAGTAIHFAAPDIAADSAYVEFTGVFVRTSDRKSFPYRVLFGKVRDGSGTVVPVNSAPDTTILRKQVTLGSVRSPVTVTTALYEAEDNVAKLKLP
jgi:hypothetical protein